MRRTEKINDEKLKADQIRMSSGEIKEILVLRLIEERLTKKIDICVVLRLEKGF